jgi:hypothetical protein
MTREINLPGGHVTLVDDDDHERVVDAGPWFFWQKPSAPQCVYAYRNILHPSGGRRVDGSLRRTTQPLHKFLTGWKLTDHINGDGLDNRRANLRPATLGQNVANSRRRANSSGYKGVCWHKRDQQWCARVGDTWLGGYADPVQAAMAYDDAARARYGEYARLNFPRPGERAA